MIRTLLVIGAAALLGRGVVAGWFGSQELTETETETVVETTTDTTTDTTTSTPDSGLPAPVEETRAGDVIVGYSWARERPHQKREGSMMVGLGVELLFGQGP